MEEEKVIVDLKEYNKKMNELIFLRDWALDLYFGNITLEKFRKEFCELNKKFEWFS